MFNDCFGNARNESAVSKLLTAHQYPYKLETNSRVN